MGAERPQNEAKTSHAQARRLLQRQQPGAAESAFRALLTGDGRMTTEDRIETQLGLGRALIAQQRGQEGMAAIDEAIALARTLLEKGGAHAALVLAQAMQAAADGLLALGQPAASERAARAAMGLVDVRFGRIGPETARVRATLAAPLMAQKKYAEAEKQLLLAKTAWKEHGATAGDADYDNVLASLARLHEDMKHTSGALKKDAPGEGRT